MKMNWIMAGALALATLAGCASTAPVTPPLATPKENMIWSSAPQRPGWIYEEPVAKDGQLWFKGESNRYSTEKAAKEDARRNAQTSFVQYMGTLVKTQYERVATDYGLTSDVIDATASAREYEKQLSVNMASNLKTQSWYAEQWQTTTGIGWNAFVLAHVPINSLDDASKSTAREMAKNAERKAKEANDEVAKAQAEKAADFWKKMQEQGLTEQ
jgi:hypothetical protein